jgi:hypothetical protein
MRLNKNLTLANPDFLFNNIISSLTLSRYILSLLLADSLPCCSINLASTQPERLSDLIDYIAAKCGYSGNIAWVEPAHHPFGISIELAVSLGFNAPTVYESIDHADNYSL